MMNQQVLEGSWKELKGMLRERWGQLRDDELDAAAGNVERLMGLIQRKTGESRESIDQFLSQAGSECQSLWHRTEKMMKDYSESTMDGAEDLGQEAMKRLHAGYVQSERFVRQYPLETLVVCLGVGVVAGVVASALTRR